MVLSASPFSIRSIAFYISAPRCFPLIALLLFFYLYKLTIPVAFKPLPQPTIHKPLKATPLHALPLFPQISVDVPCENLQTSPLLPIPSWHPSIHPALHNSLLAAYLPWHADQRRCYIENPLTENSTSPCAPVLIWTCPKTECAGMGDRTSGILTAYLLAIATRRVFLIEWTSPVSLTAALHPGALDWTLPPSLARYRIKGDLHVELKLPRLPWFRCQGTRFCRSLATPHESEMPARVVDWDWTDKDVGSRSMNLFQDDVAAQIASFGIVGVEVRLWPLLSYFMENSYMRKVLVGEAKVKEVLAATNVNVLMRALVHVLFQPSVRVKEVVSLRRSLLGDDYDSVHMRLGTDVGESGLDRFRILKRSPAETAQNLLDCLETLRRRNGDGDKHGGKVYLATDDHAFKGVFAEVAKKRGFEAVWNERKAVHIAAEVPSCERFVEVISDLLLLGGAGVLVGTRSGFADFANRIGTVEMYGQLRMRENRTNCDTLTKG